MLAHTQTGSIVLGIADALDNVDDHVTAITEAYRHDANLLVLPASSGSIDDSMSALRHAARHARLHVLLGTDVLIDSMGTLLDVPPFETPFGRISTTTRQSAGGVRYITLTHIS